MCRKFTAVRHVVPIPSLRSSDARKSVGLQCGRPSRKHERIRRPTEAGAEFRRKAEYMRKRDTRATCRSLKDREPGMAVSDTRAKSFPYGLSQRLL